MYSINIFHNKTNREDQLRFLCIDLMQADGFIKFSPAQSTPWDHPACLARRNDSPERARSQPSSSTRAETPQSFMAPAVFWGVPHLQWVASWFFLVSWTRAFVAASSMFGSVFGKRETATSGNYTLHRSSPTKHITGHPCRPRGSDSSAEACEAEWVDVDCSSIFLTPLPRYPTCQHRRKTRKKEKALASKMV